MAQNGGLDAKQIRSEQLAFSDLEFEWIRQFYVQGQAHFDRNVWWHEPLRQLMDLWIRFEKRTLNVINTLRDAVDPSVFLAGNPGSSHANNKVHRDQSSKQLAKRRKRAESVTASMYDVMIEMLTERHGKRDGWRERATDAAFKKFDKDSRPMPVPFGRQETLSSSDANSGTGAEVQGDNTHASKVIETVPHAESDPYNEADQEKLMDIIKELEKLKEKFAKVEKKRAQIISKEASTKEKEKEKDAEDDEDEIEFDPTNAESTLTHIKVNSSKQKQNQKQKERFGNEKHKRPRFGSSSKPSKKRKIFHDK